MIVYDFNGKSEYNKLVELQKILKNRSKENKNEFELRAQKGYPFLTILISGEFACVHFFWK